MGKLMDYKRLIDQKTQNMGDEQYKVKGKIGLKSGLLLGSISDSSPDDPVKVKALHAAIKEVLGIEA